MSTDKPHWLIAIIEALEFAVEEGIKFTMGRYFYLDRRCVERHCVVGFLADKAGVSRSLMKQAGGGIIHWPEPYDHRPIKTEVAKIRDAIVEHFDGEAPDDVTRFLYDLQAINDALSSVYQRVGIDSRAKACLMYARQYDPADPGPPLSRDETAIESTLSRIA